MLLNLFNLFCFKCKQGKPVVTMTRNGSMVTVLQTCRNCGQSFQWKSQPLILGRYPAGNILLSSAVLLAGASISKILLVFKHMGLSVICARTFFFHQKKFLFPAILLYWERYRSGLLNQIKALKDAAHVWSGDGCFDSMGHSAKYGAYTMFNTTTMKVAHFELLQVGLY